MSLPVKSTTITDNFIKKFFKMIECKNLLVFRNGNELFGGVNLQLHKEQKIALTGSNGAGKSTFFSVILGEHHSESGSIHVPDDWQIAHMAQEVLATTQSAVDYVLMGDSEWYELNQQIQNANELPEEMIAKIYQRFDEIHGFATPAKAAQILSGLGFCEADHQKSVASFSGGWRMRLNLAKTLMCRADILLLDEPTNHLDLDAILWLEEWLLKFDGVILVISHDKAFMDNLCTHILHIEQKTMQIYTGNYSQFVQIRSQRLSQQQQAFEKQQATKAHLEDYIRRFRAKATKAKQAQSRIKQLARMSELAPVMADSEFSFAFYPPAYMASPLISLDNASIGYNEPILTKVNLQITPDIRLGILGANGAGKSTLIKSLVGDLPLLSGVHKVSETLKLGYFNQHQMDGLDNTATPLILLRRLAGQTSDADLRAFLGGFDFKGDKIDTPCQLFSGGERARLTLALIVWQRPNVLILDEPTNHLDLSMQNALMLALQDFSGALVLVSHNRQLIMSVCDTLILVADGRVSEFIGDMDDYADYLKQARLNKAKENEINLPKLEPTKEEKRKIAAQNRQKTAPLRKQIEKLEQELGKKEQILSNIEHALNDNAMYDVANKDKLLTLLDEQTLVKKTLTEIEESLLLLMDELEELERSFE